MLQNIQSHTVDIKGVEETCKLSKTRCHMMTNTAELKIELNETRNTLEAEIGTGIPKDKDEVKRPDV